MASSRSICAIASLPHDAFVAGDATGVSAEGPACEGESFIGTLSKANIRHGPDRGICVA